MPRKADYYTVAEVSELLGVAISTIHNYINRGYLRAYRFAGSGPYRIKKTEYDRFVSEETEER
jgi:excisionase family DNA binding protein